jgi:biopolymer transport protein ExbB
MSRLARILDGGADHEGLAAVKWKDPASRAVQRYARLIAEGASRERQEDYSSALFIGLDKKVSARLWILDTIVTAAPLLGLLGTIFGIMETFNALAAGGVSDPAAVSRGIGTALIATAVGIATALFGLLGNNVLNRRAHVMTEDFKGLLLRLTH